METQGVSNNLKYNEALKNLPAPGGGAHCAILGVSNRGVLAGIPSRRIFDDIRGSIPPGKRKVLDKEIWEAINKASTDLNGKPFTPRPQPESVIRSGETVLQRIIVQGEITSEADLWESSPIRLLDEPQGDPVLFLETIFSPGDLVWIGERQDPGIIGETIRTAAEWITFFRNGGKTAPFIIINPLTGIPAPKKTGDGQTYRGDLNIASYRYCMAEFDTLTREDQIRFWTAAKLPIITLIDSGGKSIHAWLEVSKLAVVETFQQWESKIKVFYHRLLTPLGVDSSCKNPSRLSRLPGHWRGEKNQYQKLLWLSSKGRSIC